MKHLSHDANDRVKKVEDMQEIGTVRLRVRLACNGKSRDYFIHMLYSFSYENKEGEIGGFTIQRAGEKEVYTCDGVGENIDMTVFPMLQADFKGATDLQLGDMLSEVTELVVDECQKNNWQFWGTVEEKEKDETVI